MKKLIFILFFFCSALIYAQQLKVSADKNPAIVGEQILIQYTINTKGDNFKSPNFKGLKILSGPNPSTQSSYSFVNGKSQNSSSTTYSFYIKATKDGTYTIKPASINIKGKQIQSKAYVLKVVKGNEKNKAQQQALAENLFVKVEVSKRNIIVGEQILVSYKLFTRYDIQNTELSLLPALNGFWAKDLEASSRFKRDVIDGVPYNVAIIKKSVLTAQKSGELVIDPMELKCSIRIQRKRNNRDPFANFFGGSQNLQEEFISSKPITIKVTELSNPPDNFKGAVGNMKLESIVDNTTINANDAITYKLTITGTGNIELIKPINIQFPEDFEVYEPKITDRIFEGGRKRSVKTFEYLLIPRYKGNYNIPSANLTVYNTKSKQYETKKSSKHTLTILESKNNEQESGIVNKQQVRSDQIDIHYIFTESKLQLIKERIIRPKLFYCFFLLPIILLLFLWIYNKIIRETDKSGDEWKNRKANKIALKRLKNAQLCINSNNFDVFFEEIEKSLWGYFADKFKVKKAELSKETVSTYFKFSDIENDIQNKFIDLLDECEFARYAAESNRNAKMDKVLTKAKNIIIKVETALK